jgi:hypothetical protein
LNYTFATDDRFPVQGIFDTSRIFSANAAPYTTQTLCQNFVLPQGARLFSLSSHTHKHGKHFTVAAPSGALIYDNFVYNDPLTATYNPPLIFDSADSAQRTLHYCSLYNNGVATDGSPEPETVTRRSRTPQSAAATIGLCTPSACAAGQVGAPCAGVGDDSTCDSAPGANDGFCDACKITGGESTENEMFILIGQYYFGQIGSGTQTTGFRTMMTSALDTDGHSMSTDVVIPPQMGCGSSHQGHSAAMHAGH